MSSFFESLSPEIIWIILGIIFIFVEFFIPGLVIAFFGVGALITALTTWIKLTTSLTSQLLVFILSSVLFLVFLRKYVKRTFLGRTKGDESERNFNIEIGKIIPVVEFIQPGEVGGKVRYMGTTWSASASEPIAPGDSVEIIGNDGLTLIVEKVKKE
ncbi:MAG: NfeD family protein [Candidatus Aminicenantes bacterium]|nr:NfeD family protein [Candidatus Aminicenantes bacterium]NIM78937.1 NfeD family protein [Candidatus Aminicenantes bacterium]NIN18197.1 NfeD family protein [Candidatus Aminicenantes bacterium]NIN42096.1 NfeD family protein [Candidatus Aminicenantes bacterium]NIN84849.1 NfeD family protein [Candidatus Aminicenantes bacterium]